MPLADVATLNLTLLCTAIAAAALAVMLLAIEFFASKRLAERAPGALAVLLAVVAAVACCLRGTMGVATGCGGLAALLLLAWPVSFETARREISRLLTPKVIWAAVLCASMIASRYLAAHVLQSLDKQTAAHAVDLEDVPVRTTQAFTDNDRAISLFHFKMYSTSEQVEQFMRSTEKERSQIIRLIEANPASNCHGWIFTGGRYGIRDSEVWSIVTDNAYAEVAEPQEGDLAVYMNGDEIRHSGLVRMASKHAPVLIESKWGPFGVYLHAVEQQPFAGTCRFYRSPRPDHLLVLRSESAEASRAAIGGSPSTMLSQR
jgi:hypothetical protein